MLYNAFAPFDGFFAWGGAKPAFVPPTDVTVSDTDLVLTVDLPGLTAEDLDISVHDGFLIVSGQRKRPELAEGTTWAHAERAFGSFERRLRLPDGVDPDAITASMDNGVLSLIVSKPERLRKRQIKIGAGTEQRELEATPA